MSLMSSRRLSRFLGTLCLLFNLICPPKTVADDIVPIVSSPVESFLRPKEIPYRLDRLEPEEEKQDLIDLGRMLFFDPRLSRSSMMSCASCHNPSFYFTDSLKVSIEKGTRRSMSLMNIGGDKLFAWQGRAMSIASMIRLPLIAPKGMNSDEEVIKSHIASIPKYQELFDRAYEHKTKIKPVAIQMTTVSYALEMFISTLISPKSRFDRYVRGENNLFSEAEIKGFDLFRGKAACSQCHSSWRFSDGEIYDIGLKIDPNDGDLFQGSTKFKTVGLRAIASRPPYMHNGSFLNLEDVIEFYDRGGDEIRPSHSSKIKPLHLSDREKKDLLSFLLALEEEPINMEYPRLPR